MDEACENEENIGPLILRTSVMIRRQADNCANMDKLRKLTGSNGWIMRYLSEREGEDVYQKDIEERFATTRSTVSRVLKGMESKGLLRRESVKDDARLKKIELTEEGRRVYENAGKEINQLDNRIESGLSDEEKATLKRLLMKIADNLLSYDKSQMSDAV